VPQTSGKRELVLLDTSAAVAVLVADHEHHRAATRAVASRNAGLAGHAAFETFSVLTRLPPPARRSPEIVERLLAADFPHTRFLSADGAASLFASLARRGIAGGSVYDALVGAVALEHKSPLLTLDRRAAATYADLGVEVELVT
jgi:predicted nucleic acid-binding protein